MTSLKSAYGKDEICCARGEGERPFNKLTIGITVVVMWTAIFLTISNVFMTFAWYYHLKNPWLKASPIWVVIGVSWGIAFFEYCFQVPGNRIGSRSGLDSAHLKIMQEAITLVVFCVFARVVLKEHLTWNYYVGFAFVLIGVFFVFHFGPHEGLTGESQSARSASTAQIGSTTD